jgi:hypothetical protein
MKELLGRPDLQDRTTSAFETAELFQTLDQKNFDDFQTLWWPALKARRAQFASSEAAASANVQDAHWDWVQVAKDAARLMQYETFSVECAGQTQGLMLVNLAKFARVAPATNRELAYVELVATAPWNRPKFVPTPKYKGVGQVLIATAISLSADQGFKGRIGLHSLPQSVEWYVETRAFTDCGFDADKKMRYFEMTESQAAAFLANK